jgi:hypothetical protein
MNEPSRISQFKLSPAGTTGPQFNLDRSRNMVRVAAKAKRVRHLR